ncbi:hypothetical protein [Arenimonas sp.]|uniref:hypothetical protein n=1 Tax=Arenimonas sp. TaxID=1872635 RepID=UPI0025BEADD2|nr:hypothetical protein [Arenimonas sp.]
MLNKFSFSQREKILDHSRTLGVAERGIEYIANALDAPSRESSGGGLRSFSVNYASAVAGVAFQVDSATVELKYLLRALIGRDSLLPINQPGRIHVRGLSPNGRRTRFPYTPDFVDIELKRVIVVECKTESQLIELAKTRRNDYVRCREGYRFLPGEDYFNNLGMEFRVFCDREISQVELANLMLVCPQQGLLQREEIETDPLLLQARSLVERRPRTLSALRKKLGSEVEHVLINALAHRCLFGTMGSTKFTDADRFTFYPSETNARNADRKELSRIATEQIRRQEKWSNSAASITAADHRSAIRRIARIADIESGSRKPNSNDRRIIATYQQKIQEGREPEFAAATKYELSGNRGCRFEDQTELLETFHAQHIAIPNPKSIRETYGLVSAEIEEKGMHPVSYETFRKFVNAKDPGATAQKQSGSRGLHAHAPISDIETARPEALTAGQVVHVDSSPEDCRSFAKIAGLISLERPSFAIAVCERTEHILGFAVAFGAASAFLLSLLLRDIVRRWGFYPQFVVNDGGPEHRSNMWRRALAWNRCSIINRPTGAPRAGQCVESVIRAINYGVPRKLAGSTRNDEARRRSSNQYKSRSTAVHDFETVHDLIAEDFRSLHDTSPKAFAHNSPRDWFLAERALRPVGLPAQISEPMTLIETSVPINVRKMDMDVTRGLRVGLRNYSSLDLIDAVREHKTFDQVRLDPEDPSTIYVQFKSGWVTADSHDADELRGLSPIERLVEGMHARQRWDENQDVRTKNQVKLNTKIDQLDARARALSKSERSPRANETSRTASAGSDIFTRLESGTSKRFKTNG